MINNYYGPIKNFCTKWGLPPVWDSNRITGPNLVYEVIKVINALVLEMDQYEEDVDKKLENMLLMIQEFLEMFNEDLDQTVRDVLVEWKDSGVLENIINEALFNQKLDKDVYNTFVNDVYQPFSLLVDQFINEQDTFNDNQILKNDGFQDSLDDLETIIKNRNRLVVLWSENQDKTLQELFNFSNGKKLIFDTDQVFNVNSNLNVDDVYIKKGNFKMLGSYSFKLFSNSTLDGLVIDGNNNHSDLIISSGNYLNYVTNLTVKNCILYNTQLRGIYLRFTEESLIEKNIIKSVGVAGISVINCNNVNSIENHIKDVGDINTRPVYGIHYSVQPSESGSVGIENPITKNCTIKGNIVENVLGWEGIDTHGGEFLQIIDNKIYNCRQGIALIRVDYVDGGDSYTPKNNVIANNIIKTTNRGIVLDGFSNNKGERNVVSGNYINVNGNPGDDESSVAAIYINMHKNSIITGNFIGSTSVGLLFGVSNEMINCSANTIVSTLAISFIGVNNTWNNFSNNSINSSKGFKALYLTSNNLFSDNGYLNSKEITNEMIPYVLDGMTSNMSRIIGGSIDPNGNVAAVPSSIYIQKKADNTADIWFKENNTARVWKKLNV